jgi:hypothetical protein
MSTSSKGRRAPQNHDAHESGFERLLALLDGVVRSSPTHATALCPCHPDRNPSLELDVTWEWHGLNNTVLAYCHGCERSLPDVAAAVELPMSVIREGIRRLLLLAESRLRGERPRVGAVALPSEATVLGWSSALQTKPSVLRHLRIKRGLTAATLGNYRIGWDSASNTVTIPAYAHGVLVNVRRYRIDGRSPKMRGLAGAGSQLYPDPVVIKAAPYVLLCEGEWDTLLARQHDFPAFTGTAGANTWRDEWSEHLRRRNVVVAYDCDDAGRRGAARVAEQLNRAGARRVVVVDLGLGEGEDITDWFILHRRKAYELHRRISQSVRGRI